MPREQILNIAKGVVRANNPNALEEFGGSLGLTDRWARDVVKQLKLANAKKPLVKLIRLLNFWLYRCSPFKEQYLLQF